MLGILDGVVLGSVVDFQMIEGKCWDGFERGRKGKDAGGLGEIGG